MLLNAFIDSCWCHLGHHFSVILDVILVSVWVHFEVILVSKRPGGTQGESVPFKNLYFLQLGAQLGAQVEPKSAPKLGQVGLKIDVYLHSNFDLVSEGIWEPLGLDFGSLLGSKIESKNDLKIRRVKNAKFASRLHGSSIFEVPRVSEFDEKLMKKRL